MPRRLLVLPALALLALTACASGSDGDSADDAAPTPSVPVGTSAGPSPTASPDDAASPVDAVPTFEVAVRGGEVDRTSSTFEVRRGSRARIVVTSDVADEVHLHGYDVKVAVTPGTPATLEFTATIPGQFEVELEDAGLRLVMVSVR